MTKIKVTIDNDISMVVDLAIDCFDEIWEENMSLEDSNKMILLSAKKRLDTLIEQIDNDEYVSVQAYPNNTISIR